MDNEQAEILAELTARRVVELLDKRSRRKDIERTRKLAEETLDNMFSRMENTGVMKTRSPYLPGLELCIEQDFGSLKVVRKIRNIKGENNG